MIRAADSLGRRAAAAGFGVRSSALYFIAVIFLAWFVVEALLTVRFWLQFTGADTSSGVNAAVISLSKPLVLPFEGLQSATDASTGTFEYGTVVAAEVYLVGAILLVIATFITSNVVAAGSVLAPRTPRVHTPAAIAGPISTSISREPLEPGAIATRAARLRNTFFLPLSPAAAEEALQDLRLERFWLEYVTIPADGGCVIAVFAPADEEAAKIPFLSRLLEAREEQSVSRLVESIGGTLAPAAPATEVAARE